MTEDQVKIEGLRTELQLLRERVQQLEDWREVFPERYRNQQRAQQDLAINAFNAGAAL